GPPGTPGWPPGSPPPGVAVLRGRTAPPGRTPSAPSHRPGAGRRPSGHIGGKGRLGSLCPPAQPPGNIHYSAIVSGLPSRPGAWPTAKKGEGRSPPLFVTEGAWLEVQLQSHLDDPVTPLH